MQEAIKNKYWKTIYVHFKIYPEDSLIGVPINRPSSMQEQFIDASNLTPVYKGLEIFHTILNMFSEVHSKNELNTSWNK